VTGPLLITTARWHNAVRRYRSFPLGEWAEKYSKKLAHKGHLTQFEYGTDTPSSWQRRDLQRCAIAAPHTGLLVIDVDYPELYAATRTAALAGRDRAWSTRGERCHIPVDMRDVPPDQWPRQTGIAGADIKANGWVPVPGSWHHSGQQYEFTGLRPDAIIRCTPELLAAILADQEDCKDGSNGNGGGGGSGGGHDGQVAAKTMGMITRRLRAGWQPGPQLKADVHAEWVTVAVPRDPSDPFTDEDFERHYGGGLDEALAEIMKERQIVTPESDAWAASTEPAASSAAPVLTGTVQRPVVITKKDGLDAVAAARWVTGQGPLLWGADNQFWAYQHGVWVPGEDPAGDLVHQRIAWLLGSQYRQAHESNTKEMIRAQVGPLACLPVPEAINFRDGLLAWQQGDQLYAHSPDVLSTVQLAVDWKPDAACPAFDRFLASALAPGDVDRMWEVIGYLLMSGNPLHKMILLYGRGFNGKGTLLRVITKLIGEGSVSSVSLHGLAENRFAPIGLLGKLANICGDIDAKYIERTGMVKQLSGEDPIDAEHKFRKPARFTNWAVPVFSANEIPASSDTSYGWRERWEVFGFPNTFSPDPAFEAALKQPGELEGIAAHGIRSLRELMSRRPLAFTRTEAGDAAKAAFAARQDPLWGWLSEEATEPDAGSWTDQRDAYASYRAWAETSGSRYPLGKLQFYDLMRERYTQARRQGYPGFSGLLLKRGGVMFPSEIPGGMIPG
jgi:P4 family phage/plasmid primase-like protien